MGCATALLALFALAPSSAFADFNTSYYTYNTCDSPRTQKDPVNVVFYGSRAWQSNTTNHVQGHTGWDNTSGSSQVTFSHGYCRGMTTRASGSGSRFHIRMFQTYHLDDKGRYETVAAVHHEDLLPCGHAVDQNGSNGSGFDQGKWKLRDLLAGTHHALASTQNWGNTNNFKQCDLQYASSNGYVAWFPNND